MTPKPEPNFIFGKYISFLANILQPLCLRKRMNFTSAFYVSLIDIIQKGRSHGTYKLNI